MFKNVYKIVQKMNLWIVLISLCLFPSVENQSDLINIIQNSIQFILGEIRFFIISYISLWLYSSLVIFLFVYFPIRLSSP